MPGAFATHMKMVRQSHRILHRLFVRGGRLLKDGDNWVIQCAGGGGGYWTGTIWFAGVVVEELDVTDPDNLEGLYVKVSISDGSYTWADAVGADYDAYSYFHVCDYVNGSDDTDGYVLNHNTQGDIRVERD